jgi:hypothetical protein
MNPNLELLCYAAARLGPLLDEIVFLGGCATGILITDPAAGPVKTTNDVDIIIEASSLTDYHAFTKRLRELGFREDTSEDAPVCRWVMEGVRLDVMPIDEKILGFGNKWYPMAITTATTINLENQFTIRVVAAPLFLATKIEAFYSRGNSDYLGSADLEDIVSVIDGRPGLLEEIAASDESVSAYLKSEFSKLMETTGFRDALPGHLPPDSASQARLESLIQKIEAIINSG